MYQETTLKSGVRVVSAFMPGHTSCSCGIWINIGGRFENRKNCGISHFIEHLAFKGTPKFSCEKIKTSIEGRGGSINAFTSEEVTCFYAKVLVRDIWRTLEILSSMVKEPLFKNDDIKKERTVIIEEIKMYKDLPHSYVLEILGEQLWPNQPLGMNLTGTVESIRSIQRKDLCDFKKRYYTNPNIVIAVAGPIKHDKVIKHVQKFYVEKKHMTKNICRKANSVQSCFRVNTIFKETEQTHIALGFHALSRSSPLKYALSILNVILGANMSSRLFKRIREKHGLAYSISSHTRYFKDTGVFFIHAGLDNNTAKKAIHLIIKELEKAKMNFVSASELRRAKDFFIGQFLMEFENTLDNMFWIGETKITLNRILSRKEVIDAVKRVDKIDLKDLARKIFLKEKFNLSAIGPIGKDFNKQIEKILN